MSDESFQDRLPYNVQGKYYVDDQCLDCALCRETAPEVFHRNDEEGTSFVLRQPESEEEVKQVEEAVEGCPCEAIFSDGDEHDWTIPRTNPRPAWITADEPKPLCKHCSSDSKPWWKFW